LLAGRGQELGVGRGHLADPVLEGPTGFDLTLHLVDPVLWNVLHALLAVDHEGQRPGRMPRTGRPVTLGERELAPPKAVGLSARHQAGRSLLEESRSELPKRLHLAPALRHECKNASSNNPRAQDLIPHAVGSVRQRPTSSVGRKFSRGRVLPA
jgi:hypothetical protein